MARASSLYVSTAIAAIKERLNLLESAPAADPSAAIDAHSADTTNVHGVPNTALLAQVASGGPFQFNLPAPPALSGTPGLAHTNKTRNTFGRPYFLMANVAVISEPGQNGHISLQVAQHDPAQGTGAPPENWFVTVGTVACRNNADPTGDPGEEIAAGGQLAAFIPDTWWYRLRFEQINGWGAPSFVYLGPAAFFTL